MNYTLTIDEKNYYVYYYSASEDLRQSTSHETNGQAKTEDGVQHAPEFLSFLSHCCLVVKISINIMKSRHSPQSCHK